MYNGHIFILGYNLLSLAVLMLYFIFTAVLFIFYFLVFNQLPLCLIGELQLI